MVGKIWSRQANDFVGMTDLFGALATHDVVLLGERHDHPDHHRLQAQILEQVGASALVGFEMFDEQDESSVTAGMSADQIAKASDWAQSGWPNFELYRPIFDVVTRLRMTPLAIHPSRERLMSRARQPDKFAE